MGAQREIWEAHYGLVEQRFAETSVAICNAP